MGLPIGVILKPMVLKGKGYRIIDLSFGHFLLVMVSFSQKSALEEI